VGIVIPILQEKVIELIKDRRLI